MSELIRISFIGITGVLLAVQFRSQKPEYGIYVGLGLSLLIFRFAVNQGMILTEQIAKIRTILGETEGYLRILLKVTGITYLCEFSAGICKDAGYQSVGGQIEVIGKLSVMFAGMPILLAVIEQIENLM